MKRLLTVRNVLLAILAAVLLAVLHYSLPQVDVVRAVGVEIKRLDADGSETGQNRTRDVYQLQTETLDGQPRVYRNEDNLLYLKFDSANLQAQMQSFAADKQLIALRHYGWRVTLFSRFPNALKAWPVEEGYRHIPVFNTLVLLGLALLAFLAYRWVSRTTARTRQRVENRRLEREAAAARDAQAAEDRKQVPSRKEQDDLAAFLGDDQQKKH